MERQLAIAGAVALMILAGCQGTAVPYEPSREIVDSVPSAMAIDAIRRIIDGHARTFHKDASTKGQPGPFGAEASSEVPVSVAAIDEKEMTLRAGVTDFRYVFAKLAPRAYFYSISDVIIIRLTPGDVGGLSSVTLQDNDMVMLPREGDAQSSEEVETLLDALASLAGAAK